MKNLRISASVSCLDLLHLERELFDIEKTDISFLHYDVVDGVFNQCFGLGDFLLPFIKKASKKPIEVHLAVKEIDLYLEPMIRAGADYIAVHYESMSDPLLTFERIRALGAKPILAYRAETAPQEDFVVYAKEVEWVLKLMVNPGFSGQKMHESALDHIKTMRTLIIQNGLSTGIQADGNINRESIRRIVEAGADIVTGGSSGLFLKNGTLEENLSLLRGSINNTDIDKNIS
jgi:ribulose-phosphate 3-epimerase